MINASDKKIISIKVVPHGDLDILIALQTLFISCV